ncbi:hypothetical protein ACEPAF_1249 [Sanghuangporus sanghuang]
MSSSQHRLKVTLAMELGDIFVKEEYRAKGLGKALFQELAKIAKEKVRFAVPCLLESTVSQRFIELRTPRLYGPRVEHTFP